QPLTSGNLSWPSVRPLNHKGTLESMPESELPDPIEIRKTDPRKRETRSLGATSQRARLVSLDALRGFDMFWIVGGDSLVRALAVLTGWPYAVWGANQLEHVEWNGFVFYDLIFPLFLF